MNIDNIKERANRMVGSIEHGGSPFMGMKAVTADDIRSMWSAVTESGKIDYTDMFKDCATLVSIDFPKEWANDEY